MALTNEQLEAQLKQIAEQVSQRLAQQQSAIIQNNMRFESFLRMMLLKHDISFDTYFAFIDGYVAFTNKVSELIQVENLFDRVTSAQEFNKTSRVVIYADDLNVIPVIHATGGASPKLVEQLLALPHTDRFKEQLDSIISGDTGSAN